MWIVVYMNTAPVSRCCYQAARQPCLISLIISHLEARFPPNIGLTLLPILAVFACTATTLLKVNQFG